ncbi:MAG TPA: hypothetical protein VHZ74_14375 [Bryobacteraceae bacterium]|jgi:hypothetical protein|nr:hypothetical protein [Bryobacteraceae bacterium]
MSFLDNLEDNLKALESRDEGGLAENRHRDRERQLALAAAPWAERLKREPFAQHLMQQATVAGRASRTKINLIWIGTTLRLEARGHRLELRPGPKGITAVFLQGPQEVSQLSIDLSGDPKKLVIEWTKTLEEQKRLDDERAAALALDDEAGNE